LPELREKTNKLICAMLSHNYGDEAGDFNVLLTTMVKVVGGGYLRPESLTKLVKCVAASGLIYAEGVQVEV